MGDAEDDSGSQLEQEGGSKEDEKGLLREGERSLNEQLKTLQKEVGDTHQHCKRNTADLQEARQLLERAETKQREHAMRVGSLLDDTREAANSLAS